MIISHRLKFAFFRVPKTGTTTAQFFLRCSGAFDEEDILSGMGEHGFAPTDGLLTEPRDIVTQAHYTPAQAVEHGLITLEQLREYKTVSFIRNPYDRQLSAYIHGVGIVCDPTYIKRLIKDAPRRGILQAQQSDWFYIDGELVVEPMLFNDYESHLRELLAYVGGIDFPIIPPMNARNAAKKEYTMEEWMNPEFMAFIEDKYARDIELYEDTKWQRN